MFRCDNTVVFSQTPFRMPHKMNVGLVTLAALTAAAVLADPSVDRRASMGFMGMRGKKDDQGGGDSGPLNDETSAAVELDKRTLVFRRPLFGGDRAAAAAVVSDGSPSSSAEGFKRAMGFVGMRGKKEHYKGSATAAGFFGMRGKKAPAADAFYGVRGKKTWPDMPYRPYRDPDVEHAVLVLHRIIDDLRTDRGKRVKSGFQC